MPQPSIVVVRTAAGLALALLAGCASGQPAAPPTSRRPIGLGDGRLAKNLPKDVLTPVDATVAPRTWGVIEAPAFTQALGDVKAGTRPHVAIRVDRVLRGRPGSIDPKEVNIIGGGFDVAHATPYYVDITYAALSGWSLSDHTPTVDLQTQSGDGDLARLSSPSTMDCPVAARNPSYWDVFGVERHRCKMVLATGTARPTRLFAAGPHGTGLTSVYFALPEPVDR